jgi:hypothetical protein
MSASMRVLLLNIRAGGRGGYRGVYVKPYHAPASKEVALRTFVDILQAVPANFDNQLSSRNCSDDAN